MAIKYTQDIDLTTQRIINLGAPTSATDAANKQYVDNVALGLTWKLSVRAATTVDIDLDAPGATIDGVTMADDDRFLAKNQSDPAENGIYDFNGAAVPATRSSDADTSDRVMPGLAVSVEEGTANEDTSYVLTTDGPITLDTTDLLFGLMNGGSGPTYTEGDGVDITGGVVSVEVVADGGVLVDGTGLSVDPDVVVRKFVGDVGDGVETNIVVNHALDTRDVNVQVYTNGTPWDTVVCEVNRTDADNVELVFGTAPASAAYRVVVHA